MGDEQIRGTIFSENAVSGATLDVAVEESTAAWVVNLVFAVADVDVEESTAAWVVNRIFAVTCSGTTSVTNQIAKAIRADAGWTAGRLDGGTIQLHRPAQAGSHLQRRIP